VSTGGDVLGKNLREGGRWEDGGFKKGDVQLLSSHPIDIGFKTERGIISDPPMFSGDLKGFRKLDSSSLSSWRWAALRSQTPSKASEWIPNFLTGDTYRVAASCLPKPHMEVANLF
jgi:hypothetical protein